MIVNSLARMLSSVAAWIAVALLFGCDWMPGKPTKAERPVLPSSVMRFDALYGQNCAGCHGAEGELGASLPLNSPVYLAWIGKEMLIQLTSEGIADTAMPGFLDSTGGTLTQRSLLIEDLRAIPSGARSHIRHSARAVTGKTARAARTEGQSRMELTWHS